MKVRIFKPAKTAMQSGQANTREWLLESEPAPKILDPLMGWTGSRDTMQQVQLWFHTLDEAKARAAEVRARRGQTNIHIGRWNWDDPQAGSAQVAAPVSDEERLAVLKMLKEKKISLEEAERLLSALEGK